MKKLITLIMATMLLFALVGCGEPVEDRTDPDKVYMCYIKVEVDGDCELLILRDDGWQYVQYLGGEKINAAHYGDIGINEIKLIFGAHFDEFTMLRSVS